MKHMHRVRIFQPYTFNLVDQAIGEDGPTIYSMFQQASTFTRSYDTLVDGVPQHLITMHPVSTPLLIGTGEKKA